MVLRLFRALMPKEERFVEHFAAHAQRLVAAADALAALMAAPAGEQAARAAEIGAIESEADAITRETIIALHRAFITPFDRSDIHALINALDDAVDLMEEVAENAALYGVDRFDRHMQAFGGEIQKAARVLADVMPLLSDITRNAERITGLCDEVGKIESQADRLLRTALSELIAERPDTIAFLGRKEVYDLLEAVTDRCANVADVIEGIVLDNV
ncbi:DUF47 domain-containing protein [Azospirillum sp. ST 5-10]|uniref:DUF47 domain-containing protein n=1 Tax=unclassified Azospirillum TaxID=2630922 RepID=UPI003F49DCE0